MADVAATQLYSGGDSLPAFQATQDTSVEQAPGGEATDEPEKKRRGKPKDPYAPPRPKNAYSRFTAENRERLKTERPELTSDLAGMGKALAEEWNKVPQETKDKMTAEYEKEMEIWKPKWAEYKLTDHYKTFLELKTDYLDGKARKKLVKTMNKDAPKRPKSGYMIYAGTVREKVMEECKQQGLGMGDGARKISEGWNALSEVQKAKYAEESASQKAVFDVEWLKYQKSEQYKAYMEAKAKLEAKQQLKKLIRTKMDEAPKRAPSAFSLFRSTVLPSITEANQSKPESEKLAMGGIAKLCAQKWTELPEQKRKEFGETALRLKDEYDEKLKEFKRKIGYTEFLEQRQKIKVRENRQVNLRDMPKRPKSVFAMYAADHKNEVTPGKGEGKGTSALKQKFLGVTAEEKLAYEAKERELKEEWARQVQDFKDGDKYKAYIKTTKIIKLEFTNEAMKVSTMRFLSEAPAPPPRSPFALFLNEKRKADANEAGEDVSANKKIKREEVVNAKSAWLKLDRNVRLGYEVERKEQLKIYEGEIKIFMESEKWTEYVKEAKRLRIPVKHLMLHKKKVVKGLRGTVASVPVPRRPDSYPQKGKSALQIFVAEKRGEVGSQIQVAEMWENLGEEGQRPYKEAAIAQKKEYEQSMIEFKQNDEGKTYFREVKTAQRRRRVIKAKNAYLKEMPKKPASAVSLWVKENYAKLKRENPLLKGFELKAKVGQAWKDLDPEEKAKFEAKGNQRMAEYLESEKQFKASQNWQSYLRATRVKKMGKSKARAKSFPGPPKPASMPKKPLNAFQSFMSAKSGEGANKSLAEMTKLFSNLSADEKKEYLDEAQKRVTQYHQDMEEWQKSDAGKKYLRDTVVFNKRKRTTDARNKYLKNEPKKPPGAYQIFVEENRQKILQDLPAGGNVMKVIGERWTALSADEKERYVELEKEKRDEFNESMTAFKNTPDYKRYMAVMNSVQGKKKVKATAVAKGPAKPDSLPKKPLSPFFQFIAEERARNTDGDSSIKAMNQKWLALGAEGQKEYVDKVNELNRQYEKDMVEFNRSVEGKKYLREKGASEKKSRIAAARHKHLEGPDAPVEPKRPPSSYFIFVSERKSSISAEGDKPGDVAKKLTDAWSAMDADEKKTFDDKALELKKKYDEDLAEYRNSQGYKNYMRVFNAVNGTAARAKNARAKAKAVAAKSRGKPAKTSAEAKDSDSDSDEMGSESDSDSSSDSDSD